jgi:hypothetical protein
MEKLVKISEIRGEEKTPLITRSNTNKEINLNPFHPEISKQYFFTD